MQAAWLLQDPQTGHLVSELFQTSTGPTVEVIVVNCTLPRETPILTDSLLVPFLTSCALSPPDILSKLEPGVAGSGDCWDLIFMIALALTSCRARQTSGHAALVLIIDIPVFPIHWFPFPAVFAFLPPHAITVLVVWLPPPYEILHGAFHDFILSLSGLCALFSSIIIILMPLVNRSVICVHRGIRLTHVKKR